VKKHKKQNRMQIVLLKKSLAACEISVHLLLNKKRRIVLDGTYLGRLKLIRF